MPFGYQPRHNVYLSGLCVNHWLARAIKQLQNIQVFMRMCDEASFRWIGLVNPMGFWSLESDPTDAVRKLTAS